MNSKLLTTLGLFLGIGLTKIPCLEAKILQDTKKQEQTAQQTLSPWDKKPIIKEVRFNNKQFYIKTDDIGDNAGVASAEVFENGVSIGKDENNWGHNTFWIEAKDCDPKKKYTIKVTDKSGQVTYKVIRNYPYSPSAALEYNEETGFLKYIAKDRNGDIKNLQIQVENGATILKNSYKDFCDYLEDSLQVNTHKAWVDSIDIRIRVEDNKENSNYYWGASSTVKLPPLEIPSNVPEFNVLEFDSVNNVVRYDINDPNNTMKQLLFVMGNHHINNIENNKKYFKKTNRSNLMADKQVLKWLDEHWLNITHDSTLSRVRGTIPGDSVRYWFKSVPLKVYAYYWDGPIVMQSIKMPQRELKEGHADWVRFQFKRDENILVYEARANKTNITRIYISDCPPLIDRKGNPGRGGYWNHSTFTREIETSSSKHIDGFIHLKGWKDMHSKKTLYGLLFDDVGNVSRITIPYNKKKPSKQIFKVHGPIYENGGLWSELRKTQTQFQLNYSVHETDRNNPLRAVGKYGIKLLELYESDRSDMRGAKVIKTTKGGYYSLDGRFNLTCEKAATKYYQAKTTNQGGVSGWSKVVKHIFVGK